MPVARSDLQPIDQEELILGQALPGDLRDEEGRVILPAGQVLEPEHLQQLGTRLVTGLYAGPDWRDRADKTVSSPEAVTDPDFRAQRGQTPFTDKRAHERRSWSVPLTLRIQETGGRRVVPRAIRAVTVDLSRGGFAFCYRQYIAVGTLVQAQFDSLPNRPRLAGITRNCRLIRGTMHLIGVQFIEPSKSLSEQEPAGPQ